MSAEIIAFFKNCQLYVSFDADQVAKDYIKLSKYGLNLPQFIATMAQIKPLYKDLIYSLGKNDYFRSLFPVAKPSSSSAILYNGEKYNIKDVPLGKTHGLDCVSCNTNQKAVFWAIIVGRQIVSVVQKANRRLLFGGRKESRCAIMELCREVAEEFPFGDIGDPDDFNMMRNPLALWHTLIRPIFAINIYKDTIVFVQKMETFDVERCNRLIAWRNWSDDYPPFCKELQRVEMVDLNAEHKGIFGEILKKLRNDPRL